MQQPCRYISIFLVFAFLFKKTDIYWIRIALDSSWYRIRTHIWTISKPISCLLYFTDVHSVIGIGNTLLVHLQVELIIYTVKGTWYKGVCFTLSSVFLYFNTIVYFKRKVLALFKWKENKLIMVKCYWSKHFGEKIRKITLQV